MSLGFSALLIIFYTSAMASMDIETDDQSKEVLLRTSYDNSTKCKNPKFYWIIFFIIGVCLGGLITNIDRLIDVTSTNNNSNDDDLIKSLNTEIDNLCIFRGVGGCGVSAYFKSQLVYNYGSGYIDIDNKTSSIMRIASITKPITSTAIAILIENNDKDITFDSTIFDVIQHNETILTAFQTFDTLNEYMHNITIAQLLSHKSGFRHYETLYEYTWNFNHTSGSTVLLSYLSLFGNDPLEFEPGTGYKYSSFGYYILSIIIEVLSEMSYYDYLKQNVFDKLEMTDSGNMKSITSPYKLQYIRECENINRTYKTTVVCSLNDEYSTSYYDEAVYFKKSAGGVLSTSYDIAKFGLNVIWNKKDFLRQEIYDKIFYGYSEVNDNDYYGFGWHFDKETDPEIIWHTGGAIGGISYLKINKSAQFVVAVICDTQYQGAIIYEIADAVQDYFV